MNLQGLLSLDELQGRVTRGEVDTLLVCFPDMQGRLVYQKRLAAWSQVHHVELPGEARGMYHCRLTWGSRATSVRIILQP